MADFYEKVRRYLRAVQAGDIGGARAPLHRYPSLVQEEETLLAPIYFGRPEITDEVIAKLMQALDRDRVANVAIGRLIYWFGDTCLTMLEPEILRFLRHPNPEIRDRALIVLSLH